MLVVLKQFNRSTNFGKSLLPTGTFNICRFVRLGLVPTGHRFGVLMGRVSAKRLSSIVSEVQATIAFQLHLQVVASLFRGMGPKVPAERLRQSLYTVRRIRRRAVGRREFRTPKLRTEGQAPSVLK